MPDPLGPDPEATEAWVEFDEAPTLEVDPLAAAEPLLEGTFV